jgi:ketosteroid isomerase-like protein
MPQENVDLLRGLFNRTARGDFSRWFAEVSDDFVFVASPELPDAGTYRGEDARQWITAWVESFQGHTIAAMDFIEAGDKVFFAILQRGRPRGSQVAVEGGWWVVSTFRDGRVVRVEVFPDRAQALEAAGLRE